MIRLTIKIYTYYNNLTCNIFNTDIMLRCRIILEYYGPEIEYTQGKNYMVVYALWILPTNGNQDTT